MIRSLPLALGMIVCLSVSQSSAATITITSDSTYQTIVGFGSMEPGAPPGQSGYTGYPWEYTDMKETLVRIHQDPEFNVVEAVNDNADPKVLDTTKFTFATNFVNGIKAAYAAGCSSFYPTIWSPPSWMKTNNNYAGGKLSANMYEEFGEYCLGTAISFKKKFGFVPFAIGVQNEPEFVEPYGSCVYTPTELKNAVLAAGRRLNTPEFKAFCLPSKPTTLLYPEALPEQGNLMTFFQAVNNDPEAKNYVGVFAIHNYDRNGTAAANPNAALWTSYWKEAQRVEPKKMTWMSETSRYELSLWFAYNMGVHVALYYGHISGWSQYYFDSYTGGNGKIMQGFKSYANYVRRGAIQFKTISSDMTNVSVTAYKNPVDRVVTFVVLNSNAAAQQITITGTDLGILPDKLDAFTTSETMNCAANGSALKNGGFAFTLPGKSITALTGPYAGGVGVRHKADGFIQRKDILLRGGARGENPRFASSVSRLTDIRGRSVPLARSADGSRTANTHRLGTGLLFVHTADAGVSPQKLLVR